MRDFDGTTIKVGRDILIVLGHLPESFTDVLRSRPSAQPARLGSAIRGNSRQSAPLPPISFSCIATALICLCSA
jgi:hypothetical protein